MAVAWTLTHAGVTTKALGITSGAGWGFEEPLRTRNSLAPDTLELTLIPKEFSEVTAGTAAAWEYGDKITVLRDGVRWFEGKLTDIRRSATGEEHSISFTVSGPFDDIERLDYLQDWGTTAEDTSNPPQAVVSLIPRGSYVLMQRLVGGVAQVIKTGQQISDIADFAAPRTGASPSFQSTETTTIIDGINVDFVQASNSKCGDLIRQLARWHPLGATWFDYVTDPPTFYFDEPGASTDITIDRALFDPDLSQEKFDIRTEAGLKIDYVRLMYVWENQITVDGENQSYETTSEDVFPADALTTYPATGADHTRALIEEIRLQGSTQTVQEQEVVTRTIPESKDRSNINPLTEQGEPFVFDENWIDNVVAYLSHDDKLPRLRDLALTPRADGTGNIGVVDFKVEKTDDDDDSGVNPFEDPEEALDEYDLWETPRELYSGNVTDEWMNVKTQRVNISYKLVFRGLNIRARNIKKFFNSTHNGLPALEGTMVVTATSAITDTYRRTTAATAAEDAPTGIAQKLYEDLSILRHSGTITLEADDLALVDSITKKPSTTGTVEIVPGDVLDITHSGNSEWDSMQVLVQQVEEDIQLGSTTISIGLPEQLGLQDLIAVASLWYNNPPSFTTSDQRETGSLSGSSKSVGGQKQPKLNLPPPVGAALVPAEVTLQDLVKGDKARKVFVEPFSVIVDRDVGGLTRKVKIMAAISGTALDADDPPNLDMPKANTRSVYAEIDFDSAGVAFDVNVAIAATTPADEGGVGGKEYLELATIDTTVEPAEVVQVFEGNFYHPRKWTTTPQVLNLTTLVDKVGDDNCVTLTTTPYTLQLPPWITAAAGAVVTKDLQKCDTATKQFYPSVSGGELTIAPGYAFLPKETGGTVAHEVPQWHQHPYMPVIGSTALDDGTPPTLSLTVSATNIIYLKIPATMRNARVGDDDYGGSEVGVDVWNSPEGESAHPTGTDNPAAGSSLNTHTHDAGGVPDGTTEARIAHVHDLNPGTDHSHDILVELDWIAFHFDEVKTGPEFKVGTVPEDVIVKGGSTGTIFYMKVGEITVDGAGEETGRDWYLDGHIHYPMPAFLQDGNNRTANPNSI